MRYEVVRREDPPPPPIETVALYLSAEEANLLGMLFGSFSPSHVKSALGLRASLTRCNDTHRLTSLIYDSFHKEGII